MTACFNKERTQQLMEMYRLDALLVTHPIHVRYFTGYHSWLENQLRQYMIHPGGSDALVGCMALITGKSKVTLFCPELHAADTVALPADQVVLYGADESPQRDSSSHKKTSRTPQRQKGSNIFHAIDQTLRTHGLKKARIGYDSSGLTREQTYELKKLHPHIRFLSATNVIRLIRAVKTEHEISLLQKAARISESSIFDSLKSFDDQMTTIDLANTFRQQLSGQHADFDHLAFSIRGNGIATMSTHTPREGEIMYLDFGCVYSGYCSDSGFSFCLKPKASSIQRHQKKYAILKECIDLGASLLQPGKRCSEVIKSMIEFLKKNQITHSHPQGHGLGCEIREYPILMPPTGLPLKDQCMKLDSDMLLEKNMVINLETMIFNENDSALHIEKSFLIKYHTAKELIPQNRNIIFTPHCLPSYENHTH